MGQPVQGGPRRSLGRPRRNRRERTLGEAKKKAGGRIVARLIPCESRRRAQAAQSWESCLLGGVQKDAQAGGRAAPGLGLAPMKLDAYPVGGQSQTLQVLERTEEGVRRRQLFEVRFVPMTGKSAR